jgi:signal transduction histidine kinase
MDDQRTVPLLWAEVSDSGAGVPPHVRPDLFKPFIASDFSDTGKNGGIGLGLSMVRRIAEALGGQAYHRPLQPHGSVFGFTAEIRCSQRGAAQPPARLRT